MRRDVSCTSLGVVADVVSPRSYEGVIRVVLDDILSKNANQPMNGK